MTALIVFLAFFGIVVFAYRKFGHMLDDDDEPDRTPRARPPVKTGPDPAIVLFVGSIGGFIVLLVFAHVI